MCRNHLICLVLLTFVTSGFSQVILTGTLTDEFSGSPLPGILVSSAFPHQATTDELGQFAIKHKEGIPVYLTFQIKNETIEYTGIMQASEGMDLGAIKVNTTASDIKRELPTIILDDVDDEESSGYSG
ncbi:MAG: carboxypeptidase-like regulatory domain-containing protein, partial [Bacteroidota bacterium]|nr:carboxypeptidase-like regulatory domain-containing protein [Bacteroidota bacterium]